MPAFWLYEWIDEYDVRSVDDARRLLRPGSAATRRLHDLAAEVTWGPLPAYDGGGVALVAGRGIDLSGDLDCCHAVCQTRQVDALFGRTLHYFDEVVVSGPPSHRYVEPLENEDEGALVNLAHHVEALLYLRDVGVADLVRFVEKPPACVQHLSQHAREAGLVELVERTAPWVERLVAEGRVDTLTQHEDHWHFQFTHRDLEHSVWDVVSARDDGSQPTPRDIAEVVCALYSAHLVSDVVAARQLGLPLGAAVQLHEDVLAKGQFAKPRVEDVAFDLYLPVIEDLPLRDVVRLRHDEWEHFEAFRRAVSSAIVERIDDDSTAEVVADRVAREVLEPSLMALDKRLRVAERALERKAATSVVAGTVAVTIGLVTGAPLVVGAGVAAMGTSISAAHKYIEDRGGIESDDLYWLWRLNQTAAGHRHSS